ncbi:MAG: hypothetical protein IJO32_06150 [Bacilli bacterium]|nr:hypothetical protein [Bacilli bacterium]
MNQEEIMKCLNCLETQIEEQYNMIMHLKKTIEIEKKLYLSKIKVLESELELLKNQNTDLNLFNQTSINELTDKKNGNIDDDLKEESLEAKDFEDENTPVFDKESLYEILDNLDKTDSYYDDMIKNFSKIYITKPSEQDGKIFTITNAFSPVNTWTESFKKSEKWKKAYRWLLPNAMVGAINLSIAKNKELEIEEIGGTL